MSIKEKKILKQKCLYCGEEKFIEDFNYIEHFDMPDIACKMCRDLNEKYEQIKKKRYDREIGLRLYDLIKKSNKSGNKIIESDLAKIYCEVGLKYNLHEEYPYWGDETLWRNSHGLKSKFWEEWSELFIFIAFFVALFAVPSIIGVILEFLGIL